MPPLIGNLVWLSGGSSKLALTLWLWSHQHLPGPSEAIFKIFIKKFEKKYVQTFLPASKMTRKLKKSEKKFFFARNCTFFYLNLNCTCSQLSFEVYNIYIAQNFKFRLFLPWKFFVANRCDSASPNVKNIILRGLFLVFLESQRPILSCKIKFGSLGGLLA